MQDNEVHEVHEQIEVNPLDGHEMNEVVQPIENLMSVNPVQQNVAGLIKNSEKLTHKFNILEVLIKLQQNDMMPRAKLYFLQ
jgi:hypothetical protein